MHEEDNEDENIKQPKKYWRDDKYDMFEIKKYKPFPDNSVDEDWVELVYAIKRENNLSAKDLA